MSGLKLCNEYYIAKGDFKIDYKNGFPNRRYEWGYFKK